MNWKYSGKATATSSFVEIDIGFYAENIILQAASTNTRDLQFSWLGSNVDGDIERGEPLTIQPINVKKIWIRGSGGAAKYRLWAWKL